MEGIVRYEGVGSAGMEIMGSVMGYFSVTLPGQHAKEIAVFVNEPALEMLAADREEASLPGFNDAVVRAVGLACIEQFLAAEKHIPTSIVISRATLQAHPDLITRAHRELALVPA
ncbi:MAG: hypothetical protein IT303_00820 [Dehalococcoidia bacterium]|nr:hypothetical protein [Dehalococcoidia bacterium]